MKGIKIAVLVQFAEWVDFAFWWSFIGRICAYKAVELIGEVLLSTGPNPPSLLEDSFKEKFIA